MKRGSPHFRGLPLFNSLNVQVVEEIDQKSVAERVWQGVQHFIDEGHLFGQVGACQTGAGGQLIESSFRVRALKRCPDHRPDAVTVDGIHLFDFFNAFAQIRQ